MLARMREPVLSPVMFSNSSAAEFSLRVAMYVMAPSSSSVSTSLLMRCNSLLRSSSATHSRKSRQLTCGPSLAGAVGGDDGSAMRCSMISSLALEGLVQQSDDSAHQQGRERPRYDRFHAK